jgi:hypothetical protein
MLMKFRYGKIQFRYHIFPKDILHLKLPVDMVIEEEEKSVAYDAIIDV